MEGNIKKEKKKKKKKEEANEAQHLITHIAPGVEESIPCMGDWGERGEKEEEGEGLERFSTIRGKKCI